ncbi:hypothetical protein ACFV0O_27160 [Kitasatospora sp. NPDC059577]|uniref:hypothetical protein n=1 Tax=Kitasatospora sp. NPDC059577 TaxID=3346873 RepID=UPI0036A9C31B
MPLTRSDMVDVRLALDLVGSELQVFPVGRATVAVGTVATVIIAEAVDDPLAGGVWNDQELRLRGSVPALAASRLTGRQPFAGTEPDRDLPVYLFVRVAELCAYVGPVRHSRSSWVDGELYSCHLRIDPPLSCELLGTVRPSATSPSLPSLDWLDHSVSEPGKALELFITGWYPESGEPPAVAEIPRSIPPALADFYRLAERRPAILGGQNRIEPVDTVRPDSSAGYLVFAVENQGGWEWSIPWDVDASNTDPAVWINETDRPVPEQEPLSRFLLQFSLYEAAMTASYKAFPRNFPKRLLPSLESRLQRVPLRTFMSPIAPTEFLVGPGVVALITPTWQNEDEVDVWIGALHRNALQPLRELGVEWQRFDG